MQLTDRATLLSLFLEGIKFVKYANVETRPDGQDTFERLRNGYHVINASLSTYDVIRCSRKKEKKQFFHFCWNENVCERKTYGKALCPFFGLGLPPVALLYV